MLKLEEITKDAQLSGVVPDQIVRIAQVEKVGDHAVTIIYRDSQGKLGEQMLFRTDEARLELAQAGRPWAFDANGEDFKLGLEAYRISQAALFDPMMAVHTSNVDPLPHRCMKACCRASPCDMSWPMTPVLARPSWRAC